MEPLLCPICWTALSYKGVLFVRILVSHETKRVGVHPACLRSRQGQSAPRPIPGPAVE